MGVHEVADFGVDAGFADATDLENTGIEHAADAEAFLEPGSTRSTSMGLSSWDAGHTDDAARIFHDESGRCRGVFDGDGAFGEGRLLLLFSVGRAGGQRSVQDGAVEFRAEDERAVEQRGDGLAG